MIDTHISRQQLSQGLHAIGLTLTHIQQETLLNYLQLLNKWNRVYNLTAIRDPHHMLTHHLLDTLAAIPMLNKWAKNCPKLIRILDVGSGGGLPGIPWAIACPEWQLNLIDIVQKKTAFLLQTQIQLNIKNLHVITGRIELLSNYISDAYFDILVCRAFSSLSHFLHIAKPWLLPNGLAIAFKGTYPKEELKTLPSDWQIQEIHAITIPGLDAQRHVIWLNQITNKS